MPRPDSSHDQGDTYSLTRAIASAVENCQPGRVGKPNGLEGEVSREIELRTGEVAKGFYVPMTASLPRGEVRTLGTSQGAGALAVSVPMESLIDALRVRSIISLLGSQAVEVLGWRQISMPRVSTTSSVSWVGEGNSPSAGTKPGLVGVTFTPFTATAFVDASRQAIVAQPGLQDVAITDLLRSLAIDLDRVAISGNGTTEPEGLLQNPSVSCISLGSAGAAPTLAAICLCESTLAGANVPLAGAGWAVSPKTQSALRRAEKVSGTGRMLLPDTNLMLGYKVAVSSHLPDNSTKSSGSNLGSLILGAWDFLTIAYFGALDVAVNPYTLNSGYIRISAFMDVDVQCRHTEGFAKIVDIVTT
jgi:HK97 family phage major capsid protein